MDPVVLQTDFEANLPPLLSAIIERLKQEGIYLDDTSLQEKKSSWAENKAVAAMHEAIHHAALLLGGHAGVADAARLLEKIQVAATVAQKAAFITHTNRARRCSDAIQQIAHECREYFHDLKASHRLLRKN